MIKKIFYILASFLFLTCSKNQTNQSPDLKIALKDSRTIDAIDICKYIEFNESTTRFILVENNINIDEQCDSEACVRVFTPTKRYDVNMNDVVWEPGLSGKTDVAADARLSASALTKYDVNWDITKSYRFKRRFQQKTSCLDPTPSQEFRYSVESVIIDEASGKLLAIAGEDIPLAPNGLAITDNAIAPNFEITWSDISCTTSPHTTTVGGGAIRVAIKIRDKTSGAQVQVSPGFRDKLIIGGDTFILAVHSAFVYADGLGCGRSQWPDPSPHFSTG